MNRRPSDWKPRTISASMIAAIEMARKHGGTLEIRPGGFWTWPGCPAVANGVPEWYVPTVTVRGLTVRRLAEITQHHNNGTPLAIRVFERPEEISAQRDARDFGLGFVREHPSGRLEHIPNSQMRLFTRPNPAEY